MKNVAFLWLTEPRPRLEHAQKLLRENIESRGLSPLAYPAGLKLVLLGDVLKWARTQTDDTGFVWCNTDVILTRSPFDVPDLSKVYGFRRREVPGGNYVHGIDMFYIPLRFWDDVLSKDIPPLWIGSSYVDWWIARAAEKHGNYERLCGYIDHPSHPKSSAANNDANPYYQDNFRSYNQWAVRNGLDPIPGPPYLIPRLGHVWGIRHAFQRLLERRSGKPTRQA